MKIIALTALVLSLLSSSVFADWTLNSKHSKLTFVATKKTHVSEVHQFTALAGSVDEKGKASIDIDLSSIDSKIDIRDSRMKEFLFEVVTFPKARLTANVQTLVDSLNKTGYGRGVVQGQLDLHGHKQDVSIELLAFKVHDEVVVVSSSPVIINASAYNMAQGVEKLKELAGLPSIGYSVPVSFVLSFDTK